MTSTINPPDDLDLPYPDAASLRTGEFFRVWYPLLVEELRTITRRPAAVQAVGAGLLNVQLGRLALAVLEDPRTAAPLRDQVITVLEAAVDPTGTVPAALDLLYASRALQIRGTAVYAEIPLKHALLTFNDIRVNLRGLDRLEQVY